MTESKIRYVKLHRAINLATLWHTGQDRKYLHTPYISHPIAVMEIVREVSGDESILIAAVLHDVVEDTLIGLDQIKGEFGDRVANLVDWLTDKSKPEDGNRATRKEIDRDHIAASPPAAKTIKLADLIHNTGSIVKYDQDFARVYMKEKELLLDVLKDGDPILWERARSIVQSYQEQRLQEALK